VGARFSALHVVQTGVRATSASYAMGTGDFRLGIKRLGHEADYSN
jgi:hypothetical protein